MDVKTVWSETGATVRLANKIDYDKASTAVDAVDQDVRIKKTPSSFEIEITSNTTKLVKSVVALIKRI